LTATGAAKPRFDMQWVGGGLREVPLTSQM